MYTTEKEIEPTCLNIIIRVSVLVFIIVAIYALFCTAIGKAYYTLNIQQDYEAYVINGQTSSDAIEGRIKLARMCTMYYDFLTSFPTVYVVPYTKPDIYSSVPLCKHVFELTK